MARKILLIFTFIFLNAQFLPAQNFNIPPIVNIEEQSTAFGPISYNIRIWGWSTNGKVAYSTEYEWSEINQNINFVILDLITDRELFKIHMYSFYPENEDYEVRDEALYILNRTSILNALQTHRIITHDLINQKTEFLQFPIRRNNLIYDCRIINTVYGKNEYDEEGIIKYSVLVTMDIKER